MLSMEDIYIVIIDEIPKGAFNTKDRAQEYVRKLKESLLSEQIIEELMEEVDNHELEYDIIYQTYVDGILDIHPDLDWMKDRIKNSILYYQCYDIDKVNIIKVNYYKEYGNNSKRSS